ncbi:MAG: sugar phosphate isomerase/epimerase family protein [bacterium]
MQIGLSVDKYKGIEPSILLGLARKFGLTHVEITRSVFEDLVRVKKQIKTLTAGFHLPVLELDKFDFSCLQCQDKIDDLIAQINSNWRELNIHYCVAHPPEPKAIDVEVETSMPFLLDNLAKLQPPIVLENVPTWGKREFDIMYREAKEKLGDKLLGLCFDAAHCYLSGEDIDAWFSELNGEVKCIHLSDCGPSEDLHLPFDSGGILPIANFLKKLRSLKYRETINLELMPQSLQDLEPILNSYLKVLRHFNKSKYLTTKVKMLFLMPVLRLLLPED